MVDERFPENVEQLEYLLRRTSFILLRRGRDILKNFDITPPQFDALLTLLRHQDITMGELCQRLYLASSTVTDLVDRMEAGQLVARVRDPGDRRVIRLQVLERGHVLIKEVMAARRRYLAEVLNHVSTDQQHILIEALGQLHEVMTHKKVACPAAEAVPAGEAPDRGQD